MATYIPSLTGYIPQVQPFKPDYNFYGTVLGTLQQRYDQGHDQLSQLYGEYFNSPLSRTDNMEKRNEYLKHAEDAINKISALDLSKEHNVRAARKVFDPILNDEHIIKDMAFTRQFGNEYRKAEALRGCLDPDKCGGQKYWDEGVQHLQYQMEDFKNAQADDTLNFNSPRYVSDVDIMGEAIKWADKAKLDITYDDKGGQWITKYQNGERVKVPLLSLFHASLGSNSAVKDKYRVQANVARRNYEKQLGNPELANAEFVNMVASYYEPIITKEQQDLSKKKELKEQEEKILDSEYGNGGIEELVYGTSKEKIQSEKQIIENHMSENRHISETAKLMGLTPETAEMMYANMMMRNDFEAVADILSNRNKKVEYEANPYGLKDYDFNIWKQKNAIEFEQSMIKEAFKLGKTVKGDEIDLGDGIFVNTKTGNTYIKEQLTSTTGPVNWSESSNDNPELYWQGKQSALNDANKTLNGEKLQILDKTIESVYNNLFKNPDSELDKYHWNLLNSEMYSATMGTELGNKLNKAKTNDEKLSVFKEILKSDDWKVKEMQQNIYNKIINDEITAGGQSKFSVKNNLDNETLEKIKNINTKEQLLSLKESNLQLNYKTAATNYKTYNISNDNSLENVAKNIVADILSVNPYLTDDEISAKLNQNKQYKVKQDEILNSKFGDWNKRKELYQSSPNVIESERKMYATPSLNIKEIKKIFFEQLSKNTEEGATFASELNMQNVKGNPLASKQAVQTTYDYLKRSIFDPSSKIEYKDENGVWQNYNFDEPLPNELSTFYNSLITPQISKDFLSKFKPYEKGDKNLSSLEISITDQKLISELRPNKEQSKDIQFRITKVETNNPSNLKGLYTENIMTLQKGEGLFLKSPILDKNKISAKVTNINNSYIEASVKPFHIYYEEPETRKITKELVTINDLQKKWPYFLPQDLSMINDVSSYITLLNESIETVLESSKFVEEKLKNQK